LIRMILCCCFGLVYSIFYCSGLLVPEKGNNLKLKFGRGL
jgi:hypothetical protein